MNAKLQRREFLGILGGLLASSWAHPIFGRTRFGLKTPVIEKITMLKVYGEYHRPVAMNAYDPGPKGKSGYERLVRVVLSDGNMGITIRGYSPLKEKGKAFLKSLIGINPLDVYTWSGERISGISAQFMDLTNPENGWIEGALLDLVGKMKQRPVYQLFGEKVRDAVDCYDGSLYFVDISTGLGVKEVHRTATAIKSDGYKAIKLKVGRPSKWLPGQAGVNRDIEAFMAARDAVGANFNLMADANNGYKGHLDWAVEFLTACAPYEMYWIEEIFPESVGLYQQLQTELLKRNASVPVAEGEGVRKMEEFREYLEKGLYRFIQPDMRTSGFTTILQTAKLGQQYGINLIPHNWMSELGKIMSIHAALIQPNIVFVEDDRFNNFALDASRYLFQDGQWLAAEEPGWGVNITPYYDRFKTNHEETILAE